MLHWTIFVLIFANATFGGWMEDADGPAKLNYFQLHKSVGITVLVLSLFRLGWRITHPWPPFPDAMATWERVFARSTHILFCMLMIGVPLLGWAAASAGGAPEVPLYGGAGPEPSIERERRSFRGARRPAQSNGHGDLRRARTTCPGRAQASFFLDRDEVLSLGEFHLRRGAPPRRACRWRRWAAAYSRCASPSDWVTGKSTSNI